MNLKPCIFCGSKHVTIGYVGQPARSFHTNCVECGALGPSVEPAGSPVGSYTEEAVSEAVTKAIELWNQRMPRATSELLFDIDAYGEFVDEMWFPSEGGLQERDFRIMELGLPGEVGEVLELLKKNVRDGGLDKSLLKKELGDVAYYWARICTAYGFTPSEVIQANVEKIEGRHERGTLKGSGNNR